MGTENLMIVQGGGPTAVFNASLASIIAEGLHQPRIGTIYGARSGMKGLAQADVLDLSHLSPDDLLSIRNSPGAALGSSRFKTTEEDLERCVEHLRQFEIRHLVYVPEIPFSQEKFPADLDDVVSRIGGRWSSSRKES